MFNLQEAFSKLNIMESGEFDLLDQEEKDAMKNFLDDDSVEAEDVDIIDPQAEDESELEDSYVGKIIVQCPVCRSLIYKTQAELDEEGDEPQTCPYCFSVEKFELIGRIVPIEDETAPEVVEEEPAAPEATAEPVVEIEDKPLEECGGKDLKEDFDPYDIEDDVDDYARDTYGSEAHAEYDEDDECFNIYVSGRLKRSLSISKARKLIGESLKEDLENVTIETEDQVINVSAEDKVEECPECEADTMPVEEPAIEEPAEEHEEAEVIAPLDDELSEEEPMEDEVDEVDEDSFDETMGPVPIVSRFLEPSLYLR